MTKQDISFVAFSLYEDGMTPECADWIVQEFGYTKEEADKICECIDRLEKIKV